MAKKMRGEDASEVRDEEREVETRAAYAGKGMADESAAEAMDDLMPTVTSDTAQSVAQKAVDSARKYNEGSFVEDDAGDYPGEGGEVY